MREDGAVIADGVQIASTQQCAHCGGHFQMVKGSGTRRGFCIKCMKITCGNPGCDFCIPAEARLEILEGNQRTIAKYLSNGI